MQIQSQGEVSQWRAASDDFSQGIRNWHAWVMLAWLDIKHKYRRSVLGPFWITITMGVLIGGIGVVYSTLFGLNIKEYLPYIALGDTTWIYISMTMQDACVTFTSPAGLIRSARIPMTVHVLRMVLRNFLIYVHGVIVLVPVLIYAGLAPEPIWIVSLLGLCAIVAMSIPMGVLLGMLASRFSDLAPLVSNGMQLLFFVTPIIWHADMLKNKRWIADFNPFHHFVELVRSPILGKMPSIQTFVVVGACIVIAWITAALVMVAVRKRVSVWV
jgi:lipopolysaccharide transport system permease protein